MIAGRWLVKSVVETDVGGQRRQCRSTGQWQKELDCLQREMGLQTATHEDQWRQQADALVCVQKFCEHKEKLFCAKLPADG